MIRFRSNFQFLFVFFVSLVRNLSDVFVLSISWLLSQTRLKVLYKRNYYVLVALSISSYSNEPILVPMTNSGYKFFCSFDWKHSFRLKFLLNQKSYTMEFHAWFHLTRELENKLNKPFIATESITNSIGFLCAAFTYHFTFNN